MRDKPIEISQGSLVSLCVAVPPPPPRWRGEEGTAKHGTLSLLYWIDHGFNNWDVKMYRFSQFCMRFSVLVWGKTRDVVECFSTLL